MQFKAVGANGISWEAEGFHMGERPAANSVCLD
jgi:hypothetical protein